MKERNPYKHLCPTLTKYNIITIYIAGSYESLRLQTLMGFAAFFVAKNQVETTKTADESL